MPFVQGRENTEGLNLASQILQQGLNRNEADWQRRGKELQDFVKGELDKGYHITSIGRLNPGIMKELSRFNPAFSQFDQVFGQSVDLMTEQQRNLELSRLQDRKEEKEALLNTGSFAEQPPSQAQSNVNPALAPVAIPFLAQPNQSMPLPGETPGTPNLLVSGGPQNSGQQRLEIQTQPSEIKPTDSFSGTRAGSPPTKAPSIVSGQSFKDLQSALPKAKDELERIALTDNYYTNVLKKKPGVDIPKEAQLIAELAPRLKANGNTFENFPWKDEAEKTKYLNAMERIKLIDADSGQKLGAKLIVAANPPAKVPQENLAAGSLMTTPQFNQAQVNAAPPPPTTTPEGSPVWKQREAQQFVINRERAAKFPQYAGSLDRMESITNEMNKDPSGFMDRYENATKNQKILMNDQFLKEQKYAYDALRDAVGDKQFNKEYVLKLAQLKNVSRQLDMQATKDKAEEDLAKATKGLSLADREKAMGMLSKQASTIQEQLKSKELSDLDRKKYNAELTGVTNAMTSVSGITPDVLYEQGFLGGGIQPGSKMETEAEIKARGAYVPAVKQGPTQAAIDYARKMGLPIPGVSQ